MANARSGRPWTMALSIILSSSACAPLRTATGPATRPRTPMASAIAEAAPQASVVSTPDDPSAVAVNSDRALVSRDGAIRLTSGAQVYAFKHLPGWVDEASVRVACSAGRIVDVRVARSYLARASEPSYVAA